MRYIALLSPNSELRTLITAFRPFPHRGAHQECVNPVLAEHSRKLPVHHAYILAALYLRTGDACAGENAGEPLTHGELGFYLLFVDAPLTHKDRERQLIELREGQEGIDHVPDAGALDEHRGPFSGEGCAGANADALLLARQGQMRKVPRRHFEQGLDLLAGHGRGEVDPVFLQDRYELFFRSWHSRSSISFSVIFFDTNFGTTV